MSLNKTLDRLFDEIRREAKRNPDFADRLDAVLQTHASRRDVAGELIAEIEAGETSPEIIELAPAPAASPAFNPVGLYQRDGEDTLKALLGALDQSALLALIAEHNLDPVGAAEGLESAALAELVLAQVKKRVERDKKLFDY